MRTVTVKRSISLATVAGALLLGAATTALLTNAFAQELGLTRLRTLDEPRPSTLLSPREPPADVNLRAPVDVSRSGSALSRPRPRRAQTRRSRPSTAARVAAPVRQSPLSPSVVPDVQPLLTGLPDPSVVTPLIRRRRLLQRLSTCRGRRPAGGRGPGQAAHRHEPRHAVRRRGPRASRHAAPR